MDDNAIDSVLPAGVIGASNSDERFLILLDLCDRQVDELLQRRRTLVAAKLKGVLDCGEAFLKRIEDDDAWMDVDSPEFFERFINSSNAVISEIAYAHHQEHLLQIVHNDTMNDIKQFLENRTCQMLLISREISSYKDRFIGILGRSFFEGTEDDIIWHEPLSSSFESKYLQSDMPILVQLAAWRRIQFNVNNGNGYSAQECLDAIEECKRQTVLPPSEKELKRTVATLETQVEVERSEKASLLKTIEILQGELEHLIRQREQIRLVDDTLRSALRISTFSDASQMTFNHGVLASNYTASGGYAMGESSLCNFAPSHWTITVNSLSSQYLMAGISAATSLVGRAYNDPTTNLFYYVRFVYTNGVSTTTDWPGWEANDVVVFKYDPIGSKLIAHHSRTQQLYTIECQPGGVEYRLFLCLCKYPDNILIQTATSAEIDLFL